MDAGWDAGVEFDAGVDPCALTPCDAFADPVNAGTVAEPLLNELSGLAASRAHPGVLYAHNDSGDSARFFAMSDTGAALGEFRLQGAAARDWEDMALGPCPAGECVYLGDFGDNSAVRTDYAIYRVAEPEVGAGQPVGVVNVTYERFPFQYPGGARYNCETLLVHPTSGDVYMVTKMPYGQPSAVYKFPQPLSSGVQVTLILVANLAVPAPTDSQLTGGDIHPCGTGVLLRMYNRCVLFRRPADGPFDEVFTGSYGQVPCAAEQQGEAVAWSADGHSYFTASEGTSQVLHRVDCQ
jgi:hypothetical protein